MMTMTGPYCFWLTFHMGHDIFLVEHLLNEMRWNMEERTSGSVRQEQAAATRKKLLESAQKLFAENGYKGTSVRTISRSVNLADGLLYHYFPGGKKEIFQAVVEENVKQILDYLDYEISLEKYVEMPLEEVLELCYRNFMEEIDRHLDIIRILFRENEVRGFVTDEQMQRMVGNRDRWLPELLRRKMEAGEIRVMDYETAALTINSLFMNHVLLKIFGVKCTKMEDDEGRKRLIAYQVALWENH